MVGWLRRSISEIEIGWKGKPVSERTHEGGWGLTKQAATVTQIEPSEQMVNTWIAIG